MAILKFLDPEKKEWKELDVCQDGVTFIPSIAEDGTLSWTNNGYLDNPTPISLLNEAIVMKDYKTDFPPVGTEYTIYIEKTTDTIYRYDSASKEYVPLSTAPSGGDGITP